VGREERSAEREFETGRRRIWSQAPSGDGFEVDLIVVAVQTDVCVLS
jgi:hypothetical protein